MKTNF